MTESVDVLIVGAGLSGVGAAFHLMKRSPGKKFVILEGRSAVGGTWDLFRYPGIRSDSDMFTLGYSFKPWTESKAIADGPSIRRYVGQTSAAYGIDRHIRFNHKVKRASWDSQTARWTIEAEHDGQLKRYSAKFLMMCAGYYNYDEGYTPEFAGRERFHGRIIHPQHWPTDLDYSGKRVIVIGSGATAVTLVPAMTDRAAHVTMLQRSPTYMVSMPAEDKLANWMRKVLPAGLAYDLTRFRKVVFQQFFFRLARARPEKTKERLLELIREQLGPDYDMQTHFTPSYKPWEQRLCLVPDNDMFEAIRDGRASVVTDHIDTFTEKGIKLKSGTELEADIIVTATGLNLQMFGGADLVVDGKAMETGKLWAYRGAMYSDLPNFASVFGYTNASWTLRADLISEYVARLINYMDDNNFVQATPRMNLAHPDEKPFVDFSSGYFTRVADKLPKQTTQAPWKQNQSYLHDIMELRYGKLEDGALEFRRAEAPAAAEPAKEPIAAE